MKKQCRFPSYALSFFYLIISIFICTACDSSDPTPIDNNNTAGITEEIADNEEALSQTTPAAAFFDFDHPSSGLKLDHGGDVDVEVVDAGEASGKAYRTGNGAALPAEDGNTDPDCAMRFDVDDQLFYAGDPTTEVIIEIEYLDDGNDTFNVQYDSQRSSSEDGGIFTNSEIITKTGTGEFTVATFLLQDAYFGNRQYGGDFRIWDQNDGAETIRRVTVSIVDSVSQGEQPVPDTEDSTAASTIFFNGNVITMANGLVTTAIEIQGDKIVAVGQDDEIFANANPDSLKIDLQGRTLMPGLIDGHTHILAFSDRLNRSFTEAQETAIRYGFTSVNEMWADSDYLNLLFQHQEEDNLKLRVSVFTPYNLGYLNEDRQKIITDFWFPEHEPILNPESHLRIPGIKIFMDGDLTRQRGCWAMSEPFIPNTPLIESGICGSEYGDLYWTQAEINQVVLDAQDSGYRVAFHAMGDQAIELVLNAIENALNGQPNDIYRHQIEHNSMVRPDQLSRYEELDILASVRGYGDFCLPEGEVLPAFGPDRTEWYANRYALPNLQVHAYLETDYGWTVDPDDRYVQRNLDPVVHLFGLVTHKYINADGTICDPVSWTAAHAISVERALEMMTIEPAYAVSMENNVGSLEPGKFADLIILSDNPLSIPPDELKDLEVWMTMIGGNAEYCKPGKEDYCP